MATILFVDDEESIVHTSSIALSRLGYKVVGLQSGADAMEAFMLGPERFDMVITDVNMPGMNGFELAEKILGIRSSIPVLICTGDEENIRCENARNPGIREILMKPFNRNELAAAIRRNLTATDV